MWANDEGGGCRGRVGALLWLHGGALPFQGLVSGDDYEGALREYRWGLRSRAGDFIESRFDPFDDEGGSLWVLMAPFRGAHIYIFIFVTFIKHLIPK
jgi:hypothetical protein